MEELKIIISAVNSDAKKKLQEVKKELGNVSSESKSAGESIKGALASVGKAAAAAVGAIAAVTGAMVALGKSSMEYQKAQGRLVSSFQSVGSSAAQATETYKELYSFLGDTGKATEAASLLAQITTNSKDLAQWTNILQGAYAQLNDSISIEALAEAANETIKVGKVTGKLADALNWVGVSEDGVNAKLATLNSQQEREAYIRGVLNSLYSNSAALYERNNQALIAQNKAQAELDAALAQATRYISPLLTQLANLATVLLTVLKPAFETIASVIIIFVQWIVAAIRYIGGFFGMFSGKGTKATNDVSKSINGVKKDTAGLGTTISGVTGGLNKAAAAAKELKRQTMGFDELNILSSQSSASGGAAGGGGAAPIEIPEIQVPAIEELDLSVDLPTLDGFMEKVDSVKEKLKGIGVLLASFLVPLAIFEAFEWFPTLKNAIKNAGSLYEKFRFIAGYALIAAGAFLLIKGYSDAWVNGIDWGNFATMLGGVALLITGVFFAFDGLYASVAAIGAGIALVIIGFKDMYENGLNLQNLLTVMAGLAAIVGGLAYMFSPLVGGIALVVAGIVLLVTGITDLIKNGYSMEAVIAVAVGAIAVLIGVVWAFNASLLACPVVWIVAAIMAVVAVFVILWNECDGFRQFWINLWNGIVDFLKAAVDWVVKAFNKVVSFVKDNWQALLLMLVNPFAGAFKLIYDNCEGFRNIVDNVAKAIKNAFAKLWDGIKSIFSGVGNFFKNTFNSVVNIFKNIGSTVGDAISGAVKGAINKVLSTATSIINGFIKAINLAISVINAIPGVNIKKLSTLDVPKLARGGIVDRATFAEIGENGREAVLPLENNTGWMDMLADRISARNAAPTKVVLALDGKELGYATIRNINDITKATGNLPLVLA